MKRRFIGLTVALSSIALLVLVAVGFRSYRVGDVWEWRVNDYAGDNLQEREWTLGTGRGTILAGFLSANYRMTDEKTRSEISRIRPRGSHATWKTQRPSDMIDLGWQRTRWTRMGFIAIRGPALGGARTSSGSWLAVPFWFLAAPFAVAPIVWLGRRTVRWRRELRRGRAGLCPKCGYDMRGTLDRCPECGPAPVPRIAKPRFTRLVLRDAAIAIPLALATAFVLARWPTSPSSPWVADGAQLSRPIAARVSTNPLSRTPPKRTDASTSATVGSASAHVAPRPAAVYRPADGPGVPDDMRAAAVRVDPLRTYVFFVQRPQGRNQYAGFEIFARHGGQWRSEIVYVRAGEAIGRAGYPTKLKVNQFVKDGQDEGVTLVDADGSTETRWTESDSRNPIRMLLWTTTRHYGRAWEAELFPNAPPDAKY